MGEIDMNTAVVLAAVGIFFFSGLVSRSLRRGDREISRAFMESNGNLFIAKKISKR